MTINHDQCTPFSLCDDPSHDWNQAPLTTLGQIVAWKRRFPDPDPIGDFTKAAETVATARVKEAEAFIRFKIKPHVTDGQARAQAIVETGSELDIALARLEIARRALDR